MRTGTCNLPLHRGRAPRWLFKRMTNLAGSILWVMVDEMGTPALLEKLSNPFWFQAFGCTLGFDWHSSGITTTVCGALKEALKEGLNSELGIYFAGGKGACSRRTPDEIRSFGDVISVNPNHLIYASRMSAKVDNTALQDGYQIYHHMFIFDTQGNWGVIQQGMNEDNGYARRYHWLSSKDIDFTLEPHQAICCDQRTKPLNLTAKESQENKQVTSEVSCETPDKVIKDLNKLKRAHLHLPAHHHLLLEDIHPKRLNKAFLKAYTRQPQDFQELLEIRGVGPKTVRALSLIAELIYGTEASTKDPASFSFAHGGKDGTPYPINKEDYDCSIRIMKKAVKRAKLGDREKLQALKRLAKWEI